MPISSCAVAVILSALHLTNLSVCTFAKISGAFVHVRSYLSQNRINVICDKTNIKMTVFVKTLICTRP